MKPSFETFIRDLRSLFVSQINPVDISNRELNLIKDEPQLHFDNPDWKPQFLQSTQVDRLSKIEAALGNDFNRFYTDPSVQHQNNLERLLEKGIDADLITKALEKWRKSGSPANVSPFAELIKSLLG